MCNNCSRHRRFQNLIFQDHELCLAGLWAQPSYYFPTCTIIIQDLKEYKIWFPQMYHNYLPNFDFPRSKIWFAEMYHNYSRSPQFWFSKMYHNYQRSQRIQDIDFRRCTIIKISQISKFDSPTCTSRSRRFQGFDCSGCTWVAQDTEK